MHTTGPPFPSLQQGMGSPYPLDPTPECKPPTVDGNPIPTMLKDTPTTVQSLASQGSSLAS